MVCPAEGPRVPDQQAARAVGQAQALVGVQGDGVGPRDAPQGPAALFREHEEAAVGAVHVEPEPFAQRQVRARLQVVHGAGVGGPGVGHQQEGPQAGGPVRGEGPGQLVQAEPLAAVHGDGAHVPGGEAGQGRGLLHGVVGLGGGVERALQEVLGQPVGPGGDDGREVGQGAPGGQDAAGGLRIAHHSAEPAEHVGLQLHQGRGRGPDAHVAVHGVRDEVRHRGVEEPAPGDVGQVARAGGVEALGDRLVEEQVQEVLEVRAAPGQGLRERPGQLLGPRHVHGGLFGQGGDVGQDAGHGLVHQGAHRFDGEFQFVQLRFHGRPPCPKG